ncbi:MAG: NADH-quinone oxidoreductase subunit L, partial [Desulfatirhabdiaceae bacterium]
VLAWMEFGRANAPRIGFVERLPAVANFFRERWYLDHLYQKILERVVDNGLARLCAKNDDQVIDGAIHGLNSATVSVSRMLGILQAGTIQSRLLIIFTVLVLLALYFFV